MADNPHFSDEAEAMAARFLGPNGARPLRSILLRQPLFEGKKQVVDRIARFSIVEPYASGELILEQGGTDTDIFFILCGSVTISPNRRDDTNRSAGTHIGEMAAIDPGARRSATVRANEPTVLARVTEADFSKVANANPFIWRYLARELADRLRQRVAKVPTRKPNPRVFIASSKEGLDAATSLGECLQSDSLDVKVWTDGIFLPGMTNIEALEAELLRADFAALVLSPDDEVVSRGVTSNAPRDNLILELGLFAGAIGRRRAIMVCPTGVVLKLPTDLLGVSPIKYVPNDMTTAAAELLTLISSLGPK
jgi:CRP/FNR family transcriptional regulator, cyclic AMP receptor protein